jgi:hypothetical protein
MLVSESSEVPGDQARVAGEEVQLAESEEEAADPMPFESSRREGICRKVSNGKPRR